MKIKILGTKWKILRKEEKDDIRLREKSGYCDHSTKRIVIRTYDRDPENDLEDLEVCYKKVLRHEIVHAFFYESGLAENSFDVSKWARNEEMVDWYAIQGPKIYKAWLKAKAI